MIKTTIPLPPLIGVSKPYQCDDDAVMDALRHWCQLYTGPCKQVYHHVLKMGPSVNQRTSSVPGFIRATIYDWMTPTLDIYHQ